MATSKKRKSVKSSPKAKTKTKTKTKTKAKAKAVAPSNDSFTPKRGRDVLSRKNADGTVAIMRLDNDQFFYTLDGIAAHFWTLIDGRMTVAGIKAKLIKQFDPPAKIFDKDVSKLIQNLKKEKLI